uniref:Vpr n=1 Tax=Human immunodeficiency virus type 1 TaxID=11676 RepID=C7G2Q3_HV1|nr:Vpr [Human immunodeficiency virus 1]
MEQAPEDRGHRESPTMNGH